MLWPMTAKEPAPAEILHASERRTRNANTKRQ